MGLLYGVPHELMTGVLEFVGKSDDHWSWLGYTDLYNMPSYRFQYLNQFVYMLPKQCVYELFKGCSLLVGSTVNPGCHRATCINPGHLVLKDAGPNGRNRVFTSVRGVTVGSRVPPDKVPEPRTLPDLLRAKAHVDDIAEKLSVTTEYVKRVALAIRWDWQEHNS